MEYLLSLLIEYMTWLSKFVGLYSFTLKVISAGRLHLERFMKDNVCSIGFVKSAQEHNEMWRWNQRSFRARHPKLYASFDIVAMKLGESWWSVYNKQDVVIKDRRGDQIGTYCLMPIERAAYNKLCQDLLKESELGTDDIVPHSEVKAHRCWYLANFIIARQSPHAGTRALPYVRNAIVEHICKRMLEDEDFASKYGEKIHLVTFPEARSIEKMALQVGFQRAAPLKPGSKVMSATFDSVQIKAQLTKAMDAKKRAYKEMPDSKSSPLFQQPAQFL